MTKHSLLAPLVTLFAFSHAALAQVEPRMVGEWHSGESNQSLSVQPNGRYQSKVNGNVVDSGKITGTNGNWKLQSDSGRTDQGTFSFISGKMYLHGGLSGSWSHSASTQTQAAMPASEPPNLPHNSQTYSSTFGHGQNNELPGYASKPREEASIPATPDAALPPQKAKKGLFSGAGNFAKTAASQWLNPPENRGTASNSATNFNHGPRGDYVSPYWKNVNPGGHVNASDINKVGSGMPANQTTEHWEQVQWQNRPASPGWQTVPRGGYIPVMKDGKARKYWGH